MKHIKSFKIFESTVDHDPQWGYDDSKYPTRSAFLKEYLTLEFGEEHHGLTDADWGGISHWVVSEEENV